MMSADLGDAKQSLLEKLGVNYNVYIKLLGKWFRGFISKEEFDRSAKQLIKQNFVAEHNRFWLAFFHHCANNATVPMHSGVFQFSDMTLPERLGGVAQPIRDIPTNSKVRCLPSKVMTHMKIFVIVWEMGLDSINDQVSVYINLALHHFLKNIIAELICTKTAFRIRENRFKYAVGIKPMNPYLNNSLRVYTSNLEYDPYQIESNKMNSSLLDTCVYNDSLFPSRLYEAQALYEYACTTTSISQSNRIDKTKQPRSSTISLNEGVDKQPTDRMNKSDDGYKTHRELKIRKITRDDDHGTRECVSRDELQSAECRDSTNSSRMTLYHLMIALITNKNIIPSQSLSSINLERVFSRYKTT